MQPVLVTGAGPVGLTLAVELARYRVPVRIIDRSAHATETSKALAVWSRTLELLERAGCADVFLQAGLRAHGMTMHHGGTVLGRVGFDGIASPYAFALMIPQSETERLLTEHLRALGVTVERETELCGFTVDGDHVTATLATKNGAETRVETSWLIGCDGAHSTVRHGLGVDFEGQAEPDDWLLADVRLAGEPDPTADGMANYLHRDGPLVMFPMPTGRTRIITTRGRTDPAHPRPEPTLADVQDLLDARAGPGLTASDPVWLSNFRINERKVAQYRHGRVFLAGDAAHIHSPAGGQGMNTGMQDAFNLAWKLAMVVHGAASTALLYSYSQERSAVGDMVLRNAARLTHVATLANPVAQVARNVAMRLLLGLHVVEDGFATAMSETDIGYTDSPLSDGKGAGLRLAPPHYDGAPPGSGDAPRFVLYAADATKGAALAARYNALIDPSPRRPPADRMLLVRPDGYIGLTAAADAWEHVAAYLQGLVG